MIAEIDASRTAETSTYRLSDGKLRTVIWSQPVHFQDATGTWQDIDASLVPTDTFGVVHTKASAYDETIASLDVTSEPVTVAHDDWSMGMRLLGADQSDVFSLGNEAQFPLAMTDTGLSYQTAGNSIKDTLTLSSADAPNTFTFFVSLNNLSLYQDPMGGYVLYDDRGKPAGRIEPLYVTDSDVTSQTPEGSACTSASMTVRTVPGGAYVTYDVPRSWLDDPARVFPVKVDPTVTYGASSVAMDTCVGSSDGGVGHGSDTLMYDGYYTGGSHYGSCRPLIKFNIGLQGFSSIQDATLQLYCETNTSGGSPTVHAYPITCNYWSVENTWWAATCGKSGWSYDSSADFGTPISGQSCYQYWRQAGPVVQSWVNQTRANYGILLQDTNDGSGDSYRTFDTREYGGSHASHLIVDYALPAAGTASYSSGTYHPGDTAYATVSMVGDESDIEASINGGAGNSTNRGHFAWTRTSTAPTSTGTWTQVASNSYGYWWTDTTRSGYTAGATTLQPGSSSVAFDNTNRSVTFAYTIGSTYGESPRVSRRLHRLRGWSHEHISEQASALPSRAA